MDSGLSRGLRRALTTGFRMACKGRRFDSPELPHHNHNTACSKSTVPSDVAAASRLPARAARTTPESTRVTALTWRPQAVAALPEAGAAPDRHRVDLGRGDGCRRIVLPVRAGSLRRSRAINAWRG
jgi:hypothetical protein